MIAETQPDCTIKTAQIVENETVQLNCVVTYEGTSRTRMVWKGVKDAPATVKTGQTITQSGSVAASTPEVPSFTCITSIDAHDNGAQTVGLAKNTPNITCETRAVKVLCKCFVHDIEI